MTTEPEMVERVARILCAQHGGDPDALAAEEHDCWEGLLWTAFIADARTIIAAMREPTEAMTRAGYDGANSDIGGDWIGTVEVQTTIGKTAWHYMLDAATHPAPTS